MSSSAASQASQSSAPSTSAATSSRPPVTLPPTTHLDPGAYIRGTHPITFGEHNLVHPRALLTTTTHPLHIGSNNIISEKATIGGSPTSNTTTNPPAANAHTTTSISSPDPNPSASPSLSQPSTPHLPPPSSPSIFTAPTTLHSHVHIHPHAQISHSTTLHSYALVEPHAIIHPGITIGAHSKICANVNVTADVPEWTVVYGEGNQRRSRRPPNTTYTTASQENQGAGDEKNPSGGDSGRGPWKRIEEAEAVRIRGTDKEREATSILLRNAARAAVAAKRQSVQR
ncbi:uncharacterized protein HMPREF1541_07355 [Cyphellophora europaea CBS 101466]|uniref:Uncharacterized protein n=1 Tax=Cyphellophora europaea (strain CBS 101466) TaxID=1220924 RepID=W2RMM7_CYPE1|nr:uncharacterized protein HMPREF1541_07355 [Cyphellophora europaea CBS 101466]ETN37732.1 hypothetical protein HMPREF1541_07355 [Cyphellophora europaea CBS 101466]